MLNPSLKIIFTLLQPNVPSNVLSIVPSATPTIDDFQFKVTKTESYELKLSQELAAANRVSTSKSSVESSTNKKENKVGKVRSFVKRLSSVFRSKKD